MASAAAIPTCSPGRGSSPSSDMESFWASPLHSSPQPADPVDSGQHRGTLCPISSFMYQFYCPLTQVLFWGLSSPLQVFEQGRWHPVCPQGPWLAKSEGPTVPEWGAVSRGRLSDWLPHGWLAAMVL